MKQVRPGPATILVLASCGRLGFDATEPTDAGQPPPNPDPFVTSQPLANLSSADREFGVSISRDELEIYFTSNRTGTGRVYQATRTSRADDFGAPQLAVFNGNNPGGEATISRTGREIYVVNSTNARRATRAVADSLSPWTMLMVDSALTAVVGCDFGGGDLRMVMNGELDDQLYESTRADLLSPFSPPVMIAEVVGYRLRQNYPTLTDDGLELFFQAVNADGIGTILRARRPALDQPFGPATAALDDVPAGVAVGDPGISADGKMLYYSRDDFTGTQADLWFSTRP